MPKTRLVNKDTRFGRLVYDGENQVVKRHRQLRCTCDCGQVKWIRQDHLLTGAVRSCGCFSSESSKERATSHGMYGTPTHRIWRGMLQRCLDRGHSAYLNYGARGIKVCERWLDFVNFYADMGERPAGKSIERKNNDSDYEPGNCVWATNVQQARNRRSNRMLEINGERLCIADWADRYGMTYNAVWERLRHGTFPPSGTGATA